MFHFTKACKVTGWLLAANGLSGKWPHDLNCGPVRECVNTRTLLKGLQMPDVAMVKHFETVAPLTILLLPRAHLATLDFFDPGFVRRMVNHGPKAPLVEWDLV